MLETPYSCKYAIFRYILDAKRNTSTPIGVALWNEDKHWVRVRLLERGETLSSISGQDYSFIRLVHRQLQDWLKAEHLPYDEGGSSPTTDRWWRHLQKILIHKVRIEAPQVLECRDPEHELEMIFRSIVDARVLFSVGSSSAPPRRLVSVGPYNLSHIDPLVFTQQNLWAAYDGAEVSVLGLGAYATITPCRMSGYALSNWLPYDSAQENGARVPESLGCCFRSGFARPTNVTNEKSGNLDSIAVGGGYSCVGSKASFAIECKNEAGWPNALRATVASNSLEENAIWLMGSFAQTTAPGPVYVENSPNPVLVKERPLVSSTL